MKRNIFIILFILIGTIITSAQDISSALRQAQARFESGNETGGIELVNKVLAKYPDNKEAKDLLAKFNQTIKDREIDADWKTAQDQNTFEAYQQFRAKHPSSKYDDTASDNMAKKLADKFNVNSTYAERTKAESYAKKSMTKDYIANKWKAAMAKKTTSTSSSTSSTSSDGSSSSSSKSYSSGSSTSSRYGSSYGSSYSSSSSSSYYNSYNTIPNKSKFAIGIDGYLEGLKSFSTGIGLNMRIGAFKSLFNMTLGVKYHYTTQSEWIDYEYRYGNKSYEYNFGWADYKHTASQFTFPIIVNWNLARNENFGYYWGLGYEHGVLISESEYYEDSGYFSMYEFMNSDDYGKYTSICLPSRFVVLQMGCAGRHWDWKIYYKINANKSNFHNGEAGALGTAFTYYF